MGKLYEELAKTISAYRNCQKSGNSLYRMKHLEHMEMLVRMYMPSGAGIDNGTPLLLERSNPEKLVFRVDFHHMDDNGMYDGWSHHVATVTASLLFGVKIRIGGRNRNNIKEMLEETLYVNLTKEVG